jgi:DNA repair protein RadA/Sms
MVERGLAEVPDPSRAFLADQDAAAPGSIVGVILEGTRPLLVETQALVAPTGYPTPARRASGIDSSRLALLVAVLGRRAGIGLTSHDVYVNLAGGLTAGEPALDLPFALALASSLRDIPLPSGCVAIGEVGLLGELRPVAGLERRLREAARLGFSRAIVPASGRESRQPAADGLIIEPVPTLRAAIDLALDVPTGARRGSRAGAADRSGRC